MARRETPTVQEAVTRYMESRHTLAHTSWLNDHSVLRRFAQGVGSDRHLGSVTPERVERFLASISGQKPMSYNKIRSRVSLFLTYSERHGWVRNDLLVDVEKMRVPRVERFRLAPTELVSFLDVIEDPRDRGLVATAMNTALRGGEITTLRIKDLDLEDGELYVMRSKSQRDDRLVLTPALDRELRA